MVSMPRRPCFASGGFVYHVLNRAVGRAQIFKKEGDYAAFVKVLRQAKEWQLIRLLSFCLMLNHWHLVLWPHEDGDLSEFMRWLTVTHTQRWHAHYQTAGTGPLYQGRFKSFPVQEDEHFLAVCRYVERNVLRANLVPKAQEWKWFSLDQALSGDTLLDPWPVDRPRNWRGHVNHPETANELEALRRALVRGCPFGDEQWQQQTAKMLGLEATLRARGRPKKQAQPAK
jgi:putative transposase